MAEHERKASAWQASRRAILVILGVVVAAAALYLGAIVVAGDGFRSGTTVSGVDLSGLSKAEAIDKLNETIGAVARKPLRVRTADHLFVIDPQAAGLEFDAEATIAEATGRTWNPIALVSNFMTQRELEPVTSIDQSALDDQLAGVATAIDQPAIEPTLIMTQRKPLLTPGVDGIALDQVATGDAIKSAFMQKRKPITAMLVDVPPVVSEVDAQQAKALARTAIENPVNVQAGNITASIPAAAIADALTFTREEGRLVPVLDGAILHESIAGDLDAVETPGRDATFAIIRKQPVVVPSQVGTGISDDELAAQVATVLGNQPPDRTVIVSMGTRDPQLTTEQAQQLGITQKISSFTQQFPYAAYRVQNIGEAARRINGTLLLPGETFSMNDTIEERTVANGYTVGFVIGEGGVFAEELGGGVSAATTTMWTAAFFAGMERTFTQSHSIYISRYQPGLEATVAWGSFDMQFTNDTPNAVFITTKMTNTSMNAAFWGTPTYDAIKAEFGPRYDIRPYPTVYDKSKKCLGQSGMEGFIIDVDRVFYKDGAEVNRETITSNYRASPKVICGKDPDKPAKPGVTPSGSPSPSPSPSGDEVAPAP
ncbi:MAG: hypothetical protein EXQ60_04385 [Candidatus Nanopelagicales bacterium]|nr:hypothetical protein [Candidatus Nanopelagicales bacterium]